MHNPIAVFLSACPWLVLAYAVFQTLRLGRAMFRLNRRRPGWLYADIEGYDMEVGAHWFDLTPEQRASMMNGVGSASWDPKVRELIDRETGFRPAACSHDVDYGVYRTREERLLADRRMRRNCLRILFQDAGGWTGLLVAAVFLNLRAVLRFLRRALIAQALYRALRVGGLAAFNAGTKVDFEVRSVKAPHVPILEE